MKKPLLLVLLIFSLTLAFSQNDVRKDIKPHKGNALIYVARSKGAQHPFRLEISIDDYMAGYVEGGQFICFEITPGLHYLAVSGENRTKYTEDYIADSTYFYEANLQIGNRVIKGKLDKITRDVAKPIIEKCIFGKLYKF